MRKENAHDASRRAGTTPPFDHGFLLITKSFVEKNGEAFSFFQNKRKIFPLLMLHAEYLWAEYYVGANGGFTPEMQLAATQQYLGTIKAFISVVTFDVAARLLPFDTNGKIKYTPTISDIQADYAHAMTNNMSSNRVMLGSTFGSGTPYYIAARQENMTYFYSRNYNKLAEQYSKEYMRQINKQFLNQQKVAGKEFWFSHDPRSAYPGTSFEMEVEWVKSNFGIIEFTSENLISVGNYWKLVP